MCDVFSNNGILHIIFFTFLAIPFLAMFASYLAERDADKKKQNKSRFRKVAPWGVLCIFLSELALLICRLIYYPWSMQPRPSQTSILKDVRYSTDDFVFWGWANDDQLPILTSVVGTILWLFWTFYAFNYKPSATSWWKKLCKIVAYFIISITILGFNVHTLTDFTLYAVILIVLIILLKFAHVRQPKHVENLSAREAITLQEPKESKLLNEDNTNFMPKAVNDVVPIPNEPNADNCIDLTNVNKEDTTVVTIQQYCFHCLLSLSD